jgi:hypothetical protein
MGENTMKLSSTLVLLLLASASALAQVSTFDLSGAVQDESGGVLPGATLTLTNDETGLARAFTTGDSGRYLFAGMPPGVYSLRIELAGFATAEYAGLRYFASTKPTLNVTLKLAQVQESVTVAGEAPLINTSYAQVGLSVDTRQIAELPLVGRDYLDLVSMAAGVSDVTEYIPGSTVLGSQSQNINGAYARYTSYQLDGFNNTRDIHGVQKVDLGLDSIEEFRVITNQFSAEYGQSMSGIISAITKTGGNEFHGTGFAFFRPGKLDAADTLTGAETSLNRQDVGFTFSGPLKRDKTHFFTSLEYRNQDEDAVVTAPIDNGRYQGIFPVGANRTRFLAKLTHQLNTTHRLDGKVVVNDETIIDGVGGLNIFENRRDNRNDDLAFYGTLTSVFGANLVNELRVGFVQEKYESAAQPPPLGVVLQYPTQGNIGNSNKFQSGNEDQWEIANTVTLFRGKHTLKAGFDFFRIDTVADLQVNLDGTYIFSPTARFPYNASDPSTFPIQYQQGFFPEGAATVLIRDESHIQTFLQDDWQVTPHLTLNLGIRWEKETSVPDNNNVAPRLGFNWDATKDGRTSVRGGYGVFYSYVFSSIESFEIFNGPLGFFVAALVPGEAFFPQFPGNLPGPILPAGVRRPPGNMFMSAPDYSPEKRRSPYAQHFTLGAERQIWPTLSAAIDVTYILGQNLILPFDVNAPTYFDYSTGLVRSAAAADATRPFGSPGRPINPGETPFVTEGFPFGGYRDLYLLDSRGSSQYWGVKLNVTKRYADSFMLQGIYTWSWTRNNGDDFRQGNSLPLNQNDYDAEWARSATDIPHAFVLNGIWDIPYGFRVSGIFRARSGRAIDPRVGADRDGDRKFRERPFANNRVLERNSFRTDYASTVDLSLSKIVNLGGSRTIEGRFEAFNLANRLNPGSVLDTYGPDANNPLASFLRVTLAEPPRQFQVSVRFRF